MSAHSEDQQQEGSTQPVPPTRRSNRWPLILIIVLIGGGLVGWNYYRIVSSRVTTDDAYLTADITQIAPQVSGTILKIRVKDDQVVHAGDLLVELDPSTYQAAVDQAEANLQTAIAQAEGAGVSVSLTQATSSAQLAQAQAGVQQAESGIVSAQADVKRTDAALMKASAGARAATANIRTAEAALETARANKSRSETAVESAQSQVAIAQANVKVAESAVEAAQATADKTARDAQRHAALLEKGAIGRALADQSTAANSVAQAQLASTRQQVEAARQAVVARQADVAAAQDQVKAASAAIQQAQAAVAAATETAQAAKADIDQAQAQRQVSQQTVRQTEAKTKQAIGQLQQAQTQPHQVALSASGHTQAVAKVQQARAALEAAKLQLEHTRIYAPVDGVISKKSAEMGALVQPGTPLMAIVQHETLWVVANYKETQLTRIKPGSRAEIKVDALGGKRFTGHVLSIAAGTGSTFALLPPDNASGNFTKVVQRVPVRIGIDATQPGMDRLRAGLSVEANVMVH